MWLPFAFIPNKGTFSRKDFNISIKTRFFFKDFLVFRKRKTSLGHSPVSEKTDFVKHSVNRTLHVYSAIYNTLHL